jgi:hypothetical protein
LCIHHFPLFSFFLSEVLCYRLTSLQQPAHPRATEMDHWRVAVLGDGGVGKTALAVQVSLHIIPSSTHADLLFVLVYSELFRWSVHSAPA